MAWGGWGKRHTLVSVLRPKARRQGARGDMNTPTVLIAACNPRIMFYCLLHRAPSSVPYRRHRAQLSGSS